MSSSNLNSSFEYTHDIIRCGNLKELKKLLKKRKDLTTIRNNYSQTLLHIAAIEGNLEATKYLIEKKSEINAQDRQGWTAIFCASNSDQLEIFEFLIQSGASTNILAFNGSSILHYFVRMESQNTNPILYDKLFNIIMQPSFKLDVNLQNQQGETPMHMAAFRGKERSISLLLSVNANCNIKNMFGETCLHLATRSGHFSIVKLLIEKKANHTYSGKNGSIFDIAVTCNHNNIIKYFESEFPNQMKQAWIMYNARVQENIDFIAKPRFSYQFSSKFEKMIDPSCNETANEIKLRKNTDPFDDKQPLKQSKRRALWKTRAKKKLNNNSPSLNNSADPTTDHYPNVPLKNFSSQRYEFCEVIGKGGTSHVFKAFDKSNETFVAIKRMEIQNAKKSIVDSSMTELNLLKRLQSDQIVKYIDFFRDKRFIYLVMEHVESSLREIIDNTQEFHEEEIVKYTFQMLVGLDYLHRRGVIHRDIKAANILINKEGIIKLADFGVAYVPESQAGLHSIIQSIKSVDLAKKVNNEKPKELLGSPYWMAPEVVLLETMSIKSDIWSLGCTLIEILNKKPPYFDLEPMAALFAISGNDPIPIPSNLSSELEDFINTCLRKDPKDRPSSRELVVHPLIVKHKNLLKDMIESTPFKDLLSFNLPPPPVDEDLDFHNLMYPINAQVNSVVNNNFESDEEDDDYENHYNVQYQTEYEQDDDSSLSFSTENSYDRITFQVSNDDMIPLEASGIEFSNSSVIKFQNLEILSNDYEDYDRDYYLQSLATDNASVLLHSDLTNNNDSSNSSNNEDENYEDYENYYNQQYENYLSDNNLAPANDCNPKTLKETPNTVNNKIYSWMDYDYTS